MNADNCTNQMTKSLFNLELRIITFFSDTKSIALFFSQRHVNSNWENLRLIQDILYLLFILFYI